MCIRDSPASSLNGSDQELFDSVGPFVKMLHCIEKSAVKRVVFFSSGGTVYGNPIQTPVPETHPLDPISPYGVAKVAMEKYLQMFCRLYNKHYLIIRPSNPYGPRQNYKGNQGVIPIFMNKILNDEPITLWGSETISKDYIFIEDLARATVTLMRADVENQIFNIGSERGASLKELVALIESVTEKKATVTVKESLNTDVTNIILDCAKYKSAVDESLCTTSLPDGMRETRRWLLNE